ncbi:MAG: ribosome silencing factor [Alphaproteobacteria bacterium]
MQHIHTSLEGKKLSGLVSKILDAHKAEDIQVIDLKGKSNMAEYMIIASGLNPRHLHALASYLETELKKSKHTYIHIEGAPSSDWVLVDLNTVIVHLFKPEVRAEYDLESMWAPETLKETLKHRAP